MDLCGGFPAIIIKMLMTSRPGVIELLPALPKEWPAGRVQGLPSRCQVTVADLEWKPGLVNVVLESAEDTSFTLRLPQTIKSVSVTQGNARVAGSNKGAQHRDITLPAGRAVRLAITL